MNWISNGAIDQYNFWFDKVRWELQPPYAFSLNLFSFLNVDCWIDGFSPHVSWKFYLWKAVFQTKIKHAQHKRNSFGRAYVFNVWEKVWPPKILKQCHSTFIAIVRHMNWFYCWQFCCCYIKQFQPLVTNFIQYI